MSAHLRIRSAQLRKRMAQPFAAKGGHAARTREGSQVFERHVLLGGGKLEGGRSVENDGVHALGRAAGKSKGATRPLRHADDRDPGQPEVVTEGGNVSRIACC